MLELLKVLCSVYSNVNQGFIQMGGGGGTLGFPPQHFDNYGVIVVGGNNVYPLA